MGNTHGVSDNSIFQITGGTLKPHFMAVATLAVYTYVLHVKNCSNDNNTQYMSPCCTACDYLKHWEDAEHNVGAQFLGTIAALADGASVFHFVSSFNYYLWLSVFLVNTL